MLRRGLSGLPSGVLVELSDVCSLQETQMREECFEPLGGAGSGVQVLGLMEARSHSFEHVFLMGLNRGVFPRIVHEDPVFPDRLRVRLRRSDVLREIPIKRLGFWEERFLFAQFMESADHITLSWQEIDEDGRALNPSPFLIRWTLRSGCSELSDAPIARSIFHPECSGAEAPERSLLELATLAAQTGDRSHLGRLLALAMPTEQATAAVEVIDELSPDFRSRRGRQIQNAWGPYMGLIGASIPGPDPRNGPIYVTAMEDMARCPWRGFLNRVLRVQPNRDPWAELPGVSPLLVGSTVHGVLEDIVRNSMAVDGHSGPVDWAELGSDPGTAIHWPDDATLRRLVRRETERQIVTLGPTYEGFARALAEHVTPMVQAARVDWEDASEVQCLGSEMTGYADFDDIEGGTHRLWFKADRVDRLPDRVLMTDYKTGTPPKKPGDVENKLWEGLALQAALYAESLPEQDVEGRYLYLKAEDLGSDHAVVGTRQDPVAYSEGVRAVVPLLLTALKRGWLIPRLVDSKKGKEPDTCSYCDVREACHRGDSGLRARVERLFSQEALADAPDGLVQLWELPKGKKRSGLGGDPS